MVLKKTRRLLEPMKQTKVIEPSFFLDSTFLASNMKHSSFLGIFEELTRNCKSIEIESKNWKSGLIKLWRIFHAVHIWLWFFPSPNG